MSDDDETVGDDAKLVQAKAQVLEALGHYVATGCPSTCGAC